MNERTPAGSPVLGMPVETQLGSEHGGTVEVGNTQGNASHTDEQGLTADISNEGSTIRKDDESHETAQEGQQQEGQQAPAAEPLPEFDPGKPETVQAYEGRFITEGGEFNMQALSGDFFANAKQGSDGSIEGGLSEGTYKFLETRGIDRATAKKVEAGQLALFNQQRTSLFTRAGGESNWNGAIAWATEGNGYTAAERKAFNAALDAGGPQADMAVDALVARYKKGAPGGFRAAPRKQTPARSTANAGGSPPAAVVEKYASYADYQTDLRAAKATNNQAKFDEVRKRGKASNFY